MSESFYARAEETCAALESRFRVADTAQYYERVQRLPSDRKVSELWPYSGVISAYNALAAHPRYGKRYFDPLRRALEGLEAYYDASAALPAYDSYILAEGGATKYYDDNEWLGIEFVRAYRTLKEARYLTQAEEMFNYAVSGWTDEMGGGIYWREEDFTTKNTCSNGPAALLGVLLYEETHKPSYLEYALRILTWLQRLKATELGVYWDALKVDGSIDERTFTYNVGTPLHTNALLYRATGDTVFLHEAEALAEASDRYFALANVSDGVRILPNTPWFNAVLLRGYQALYEVDPAHDAAHLQLFCTNLNYAWDHARAADGSFSPDWTGQAELGSDVRWLLDQAAMVELYALLDEIPEVA